MTFCREALAQALDPNQFFSPPAVRLVRKFRRQVSASNDITTLTHSLQTLYDLASADLSRTNTDDPKAGQEFASLDRWLQMLKQGAQEQAVLEY